jgi:hypothetical protein
VNEKKKKLRREGKTLIDDRLEGTYQPFLQLRFRQDHNGFLKTPFQKTGNDPLHQVRQGSDI